MKTWVYCLDSSTRMGYGFSIKKKKYSRLFIVCYCVAASQPISADNSGNIIQSHDTTLHNDSQLTSTRPRITGTSASRHPLSCEVMYDDLHLTIPVNFLVNPISELPT